MIGGGRVWAERGEGEMSWAPEGGEAGLAAELPGDCCMILWRGEL